MNFPDVSLKQSQFKKHKSQNDYDVDTTSWSTFRHAPNRNCPLDKGRLIRIVPVSSKQKRESTPIGTLDSSLLVTLQLIPLESLTRRRTTHLDIVNHIKTRRKTKFLCWFLAAFYRPPRSTAIKIFNCCTEKNQVIQSTSDSQWDSLKRAKHGFSQSFLVSP